MIVLQPELFNMFPSSEGPETQRQYLEIEQVFFFFKRTLNIFSATGHWEGDIGSESNVGWNDKILVIKKRTVIGSN